MVRCEEIFRQICWLEERFWPDVDGMGEEDESAQLGPQIGIVGMNDGPSFTGPMNQNLNGGPMNNNAMSSQMNGQMPNNGMNGPMSSLSTSLNGAHINGPSMNGNMNNGQMNGPPMNGNAQMNSNNNTPGPDSNNGFVQMSQSS
jgi:hypothetical protein